MAVFREARFRYNVARMNSMTGFGRATFDLDGSAFRVEVRSVNNRFLDIKVHLPWVDGELEQHLRRGVRARLARGRVDVTVSLDDADGGGGVRLNAELARDLGRVLGELAATLSCDIATAALLVPQQRDLLLATSGGAARDQLWAGVEPCLDQALTGLQQMRAEEGQALASDLNRNLATMRRLRGEIATLADNEPQRRRDRLTERVEKLLGDREVDGERLAQEVALLADRADVSEELVRLQSHLDQLHELLGQPDAIGRKIEFLLQEVNRELNTIASKTGSGETSALVVEAKSCLEKMREQAQNVE